MFLILLSILRLLPLESYGFCQFEENSFVLKEGKAFPFWKSVYYEDIMLLLKRYWNCIWVRGWIEN